MAIDFDDATAANQTVRFDAWKLAMEKSYESDQAERKSFLGWLSNDKIIQTMNAQELSFKLGHNQYSDLVPYIYFHLAHQNNHTNLRQQHADSCWVRSAVHDANPPFNGSSQQRHRGLDTFWPQTYSRCTRINRLGDERLKNADWHVLFMFLLPEVQSFHVYVHSHTAGAVTEVKNQVQSICIV